MVQVIEAVLLPLRKNQTMRCSCYALVCQAIGRGMRLLLNLHVLLPPRGTRVVAQLLFMDHAIQTINANTVLCNNAVYVNRGFATTLFRDIVVYKL